MKVKSFIRQPIVLCLTLITGFAQAQQLTSSNGEAAELLISKSGEHAIRVTFKPVSYEKPLPLNPALATNASYAPVLKLRSIENTVHQTIGKLKISITGNPLTVKVFDQQQKLIQQLVFQENGWIAFDLKGKEKVLGMGEGGPKPVRGVNWRNSVVQFDRRGTMDSMQPRWQGDAYGSRNPVATLIGTSGWGLFVATPWVLVDMRATDKGYFIPYKPPVSAGQAQTQRNQGQNLGKGLPPVNEMIDGLYDVFIFDASNPSVMMQQYAAITGPAVMPPKWALGYMQSHRTLQDDYQMTSIVDTFRMKKIPIDAVIYLGTGFTPRGWNKMQPSFEFNPEVFKRDPQKVLNEFHKNKVKVVLHMVPWDRDELPTLYGSIPARKEESTHSLSHIANYWKQHEPLVNMGVDAFWPDEGDWFNLHERIKRHQLYYQGHLSTNPNQRPWSLHRNGYPGIAQWGGWVWSGDTESSWKTLEAQIAVGINYSLSIAPFWGSDIGGFYPAEDYSGEMYARWHQFAAFNASFRSHGRTWWLHLPWGWGLSSMGPKENRNNPPESALNNPAIEPVIKQYNELRYQLMPYTYTLAWEARTKGLPMMRALWLHYPKDSTAAGIGDQFLWGKEIMVAPVYEKQAKTRSVYLPDGIWYDWWTGEKINGAGRVNKQIDLSIMPLYVKAGAIIPVDTVKQYVDEITNTPIRLKIYTGADGAFVLYEDDGISQDYLKGKSRTIAFNWNNKTGVFTIDPIMKPGGLKNESRTFMVEWVAEQKTKLIKFNGSKQQIKL
ncbi:TIM-barrel domain-containing protein [Sediminibacterium sp.]|uniref:glycoside hydrolase family 31 protein n=1 Tax=Sediminibacterium sp. TaxID=1917865 RepID=UPI0025DB7299|nr:TIM-barrel domain-containing protein [Sediminibacterium sp.]MBW0177279.1 DUF5110 domain-containing protein [Sediminibacterium sp.]